MVLREITNVVIIDPSSLKIERLFLIRNTILMKRFFIQLLSGFSLLLMAHVSHAQFRVEVSGVGLTQVPIAIAPLRGEESVPQKISAIVQADLERSGQFKVLPTGKIIDETERPDVSDLRQKGADGVLTGSISRMADGRYDVRIRLWDVVRNQDLGAMSYAVVAADLRLASHQISDLVYLKLTGDRGVFSTRIAYVTKSSTGRYNLWVADSDGENAQSALASPEPIISPSWAPNGTQLAYVSFEARKPVVYVHDVATGKRRILANFKGSNSAPSWSPDGRTVAVTLSRDGGSQLFLLDSQGGEPRRLTQSVAIDTETVFSPDGTAIYFVSDRGGSPQIYRMPAMGGPANRVTFTGNYNISPALSQDGRWMAYISRIGNAYKLHVMDLASGNVSGITDTTADERPSFAPNSRLIVYATRQDGREALMTTTLDGRIKARLAGQGGDIREPHWGPFSKAQP
jgi:TolB protein